MIDHGREQRDEQRRSLDGYRWVDRERGIAQIPIDRAMQIVVDDADERTGCAMKWIRLILFLPPGGSTFADGSICCTSFVISVTMLGATGIAALTLYYMIRYRRRSRRPSDTANTRVAARRGRHHRLSPHAVPGLLGHRLRAIRAHRDAADDAEVVYVDREAMDVEVLVPRRASRESTSSRCRSGVRKLVMTSRDVIHSFYVPGFRVEAGRPPRALRHGVVRGEGAGQLSDSTARSTAASSTRGCSARSTRSRSATTTHGSRAEADDAAPDRTCGGGRGIVGGEDLVKLGRAVAVRRQCVACHTLDGQRHVGPTWSGLYGIVDAARDGRHVIADEAYLTRSMMEPWRSRRRFSRSCRPIRARSRRRKPQRSSS